MEKRLNELMRQMVLEKKIPRYVYKMKPVTRYLFDTLINSEIWFSKPKDFNDPFDCDINLNNSGLDHGKIQKYFENYLQKMVSIDNLKTITDQSNITVDEFNKLINIAVKEVIHKKGVSCFMDNPGNLLMWSHYADSHKGICLKFDILKDIDFFSPAKRVLYQKKYPEYGYIEQKNEIANLLFFKSSEWEYEGEVRVVKAKADNYPFKRSALIEVILGCNINEGDKKTIINIVKTYYQHTKILQAKKKDLFFELEFVEVV